MDWINSQVVRITISTLDADPMLILPYDSKRLAILWPQNMQGWVWPYPPIVGLAAGITAGVAKQQLWEYDAFGPLLQGEWYWTNFGFASGLDIMIVQRLHGYDTLTGRPIEIPRRPCRTRNGIIIGR